MPPARSAPAPPARPHEPPAPPSPYAPPPRRATALLTTLAVLGVLAVTAGCAPAGAGRSPDGRIPVVAGFYPLAYLTRLVGGDRVAVTDLVEPGVEPHDLELSPHRLALLADARLVVYLRGFQPAVDEAVAAEAPRRSLDAGRVQPLLGRDPHLWLDPTRLAAVADRVADRLAALDPDRTAEYRQRAAELHDRLSRLDQRLAAGLANCRRREFVTSHEAFGYLAARYRLAQIPISGLSPEEEPTPGRLAEAARLARRYGVTTIFFESLVSPRLAATLADEVGAHPQVLDPLESQPEGTDDYESVMLANLARLRTALECS